MEFANLGKHCSDPICKQKDFLPFECKYCSKIFCLDHRAPSDHSCPSSHLGSKKALVCPLCLKTVKYEDNGLTGDEMLSIHEATECDKSQYEKNKQEKNTFCAKPRCNERIGKLNTYECKQCSQKLCLKHRFEDNHNCKEIQQQNRRKFVDQYEKQLKEKTDAMTKTKVSSTENNKQSAASSSVQAKPSYNSPIINNNINSTAPLRAQNNNISTNIQPPHNHSNSQRQNFDGMEFCEVCGQSFYSIEDLIVHAESLHQAVC